eukprot:2694987-Rhodomonas_salina.1
MRDCTRCKGTSGSDLKRDLFNQLPDFSAVVTPRFVARTRVGTYPGRMDMPRQRSDSASNRNSSAKLLFCSVPGTR